MNLILFTATLIMAMAMLTYAKMQTHRNASLLESQYRNFMQKTERSAINQEAERWYKKVNISAKNAAPQSKASGLSRISFHYFFDKAQQNQKEYLPFRLLTKKLIQVLYHEAPFYQSLLLQRPSFVDDLLNSLQIVDHFPKEKKPKNARDLASLKLPDAMLDDALYKMLKGTIKSEEEEQQTPLWAPARWEPLQSLEIGEDEDASPDPGLLQEYHSPKGYYSLLDYITLQRASKVRVFLASKHLLLAIFDHPAIVEQIMAARQQHYRDVSNNAHTPAQASDLFKKQFAGQADRNVLDILDFTVTKTNPKNYE